MSVQPSRDVGPNNFTAYMAVAVFLFILIQMWIPVPLGVSVAVPIAIGIGLWFLSKNGRASTLPDITPLLKHFVIWMPVVFVTSIFALEALHTSNEYAVGHRLGFYGRSVIGVVDVVNSDRSRTITYHYYVNGRAFTAWGSGESTAEPGQRVVVTYDPVKPEISRIGTKNELQAKYRKQPIAGYTFFAILYVLILAFIYWRFRRRSAN